MLKVNSSNGILIQGKRVSKEEAKRFLKDLKREYNLHKNETTFKFEGVDINSLYAKYLIEYLNERLNPKH